MRISVITIKNYRCLRNVTISVDEYGVFIGANGSGKSSVFYALDWFFNETTISEIDMHGYKEGVSAPTDSTIEVAVTFTDLTDRDRERLGPYGRAECAEIRRTWYAENKEVKTIGNAKQGPGFANVRAEGSVVEMRARYIELRTVLPELPILARLASRDDIGAALFAWESEKANSGRLIEIADSDATSMLGFNGPNVLRKCVRFVLVPAATSIVNEVGTTSKGSALAELVGALTIDASTDAKDAWSQRHASALSELVTDIQSSVEGATAVQESRINSRLARLVPNASVRLTTVVPDFAPKINAATATAVTINGITNDVSRQGHGVQRAVMISMFQAMVPDADLARATHTAQEGEDGTISDARLAAALSDLPSIIVAIEEPELYQHPVQARVFARTLQELSQQPRAQVLLATHSPYFIQPERFSALRRFTYTRGVTSVASASFSSVAAMSRRGEAQVRKAISLHVPTEFSEGFFSNAVVLVEGPTDRAVLEATARKLGRDLDSQGVTVLSVESKNALRVAHAILTVLNIPTYLLADGDFTASEKRTKPQRHESHKADTEAITTYLSTTSHVLAGSLPYSFGDPTVICAAFTIWQGNIEEELGAWPSFTKALSAARTELPSRNDKNLLSYRNAVDAAMADDMPENLKLVVDAVSGLAARSQT